MIVTASGLRQNIYRLLDRVLESGEPLEIVRRGRRLRVIPADAPPKLERIAGHPGYIAGDPDELIHVDWSGEWRP